MGVYIRKHKNRGWKQLTPLRPTLGRFFRHPKLLMGLIVYKTVQYMGGGFGLLWNLKTRRS
jgi:hypothetical protein